MAGLNCRAGYVTDGVYYTGLEFPWNQSTAMALKIAVERNSCLRQS
jgi:hypothetical protein